MIAVDNDVISYFWLEASRTDAARAARKRDSEWSAPQLWRSEFRNVLYQHMRHCDLSVQAALHIAEQAEADLAADTYPVDTADILRLVDATGHSAYDCEYAALAQQLGVTLVTGDARLPELFPNTAVLLENFVDR